MKDHFVLSFKLKTLFGTFFSVSDSTYVKDEIHSQKDFLLVLIMLRLHEEFVDQI